MEVLREHLLMRWRVLSAIDSAPGSNIVIGENGIGRPLLLTTILVRGVPNAAHEVDR